MPRDAETTRRKILSAAVGEFSSYGYAGARIDRIASAAAVNKRMIYHYFGGKQLVFEAVLADRLSTGVLTEDLVRLWMYEALERGDEDIVRLAERRELAGTRTRVEAIRATEGLDEPSRVQDPALLTLARLALEVFPIAFPQLVRIVTGQRATSPAFGEAWKGLVPHSPPSPTGRPRKPKLRLDRVRVERAARRSPARRPCCR